MPSFNGLYATIAGTNIQASTVISEKDASYNVANNITIFTNETPLRVSDNGTSIYCKDFSTKEGFKKESEIIEYFDKNGKTFALIHALLTQTGINRVQNNTAFDFIIVKVDSNDATGASITTIDLENRLVNFKPISTVGYKFCCLTLKEQRGTQKTIYYKINEKNASSVDELVNCLNNEGQLSDGTPANFNSKFENVGGEIKIVSLCQGSSSVVEALPTVKEGCIDISGRDYLNIIGTEPTPATPGTCTLPDAVNNEEAIKLVDDGSLRLEINGTEQQKDNLNFTEILDIDTMIEVLNNAGFEGVVFSKNDDGDLFITTTEQGNGKNVKVLQSTITEGSDLSDVIFFNKETQIIVNGRDATEEQFIKKDGEDDEGNTFKNYILDLKRKGFCVGCYTTTAIMTSENVVAWAVEAENLANEESFYIPAVYTFQDVVDQKYFSNGVNKQTLFLANRLDRGNLSFTLADRGAMLASGASVDIQKIDNQRNDPEWGRPDIDEEITNNQLGLDNDMVREAMDNCIGSVLSYKGNGQKLQIDGCTEGFSLAVIFGYNVIANSVMMQINRTLSNLKDKHPSNDNIDTVKSSIDACLTIIANNGLFSNKPKDDDPLLKDKTVIENDIRKNGYSIYIADVSKWEGNVMPIWISLCLSGVIARVSSTFQIIK